MYFNGLPRWCSGKQSTCQCRRCKRHGLRTLHWENPLEEEMATHPSILAWRMPWTEEPGGLQYCCCCCQVTLVVSDSVRPHRWQPTRFPCPWYSPGKNTGVGCHFLLQCMKVKSEREVAQLCPTLSDPMDCSLPGASIHGVCQARVLEWGAIAFSGATVQEVTKSWTRLSTAHNLFGCAGS